VTVNSCNAGDMLRRPSPKEQHPTRPAEASTTSCYVLCAPCLRDTIADETAVHDLQPPSIAHSARCLPQRPHNKRMHCHSTPGSASHQAQNQLEGPQKMCGHSITAVPRGSLVKASKTNPDGFAPQATPRKAITKSVREQSAASSELLVHVMTAP
jgi:hypothetical protein